MANKREQQLTKKGIEKLLTQQTNAILNAVDFKIGKLGGRINKLVDKLVDKIGKLDIKINRKINILEIRINQR